MKKSYIILVILMAMLLLSACTKGSWVAINADEVNTPNKMSMTYDSLNGYKETSIKVKKDEEVTIKVKIVTEIGSIDTYIAKKDDIEHPMYEGNNIPTSSFEVTLSDEGSYVLRVDANKHSGSYSFSWEK